jgi:hypothetical protein
MLTFQALANSRFFRHDCGVIISCSPHVLQANLFLKMYSSIWLFQHFLGYNSIMATSSTFWTEHKHGGHYKIYNKLSWHCRLLMRRTRCYLCMWWKSQDPCLVCQVYLWPACLVRHSGEYIDLRPSWLHFDLFSTVASALNAVSASMLRDMLDGGFGYKPPDNRAALITRILSACFGVLSFGLTFLVSQLGGVLQVSNNSLWRDKPTLNSCDVLFLWKIKYINYNIDITSGLPLVLILAQTIYFLVGSDSPQLQWHGDWSGAGGLHPRHVCTLEQH